MAPSMRLKGMISVRRTVSRELFFCNYENKICKTLYALYEVIGFFRVYITVLNDQPERIIHQHPKKPGLIQCLTPVHFATSSVSTVFEHFKTGCFCLGLGRTAFAGTNKNITRLALNDFPV